MLVTRVVSPISSRESWTVLGDDDAPVAPIERYLRYPTDIERSPNTIKAYAHDLKDWFTFLADRGPDWTAVQLEDVGAFVSWLPLPMALRQSGIVMIPTMEHHCGEATMNRKLGQVQRRGVRRHRVILRGDGSGGERLWGGLLFRRRVLDGL